MSTQLRRVARGFAIAATFLVALVALANVWVVARGRGSSPIADARPARVAIVFGAGVRPDGTVSDVLADRLAAALALHRAGTVSQLLLSGDRRAPEYDEVAAMRAWLAIRGVPESALLLDGDGVDTYSTIVRAQTDFGVTDAILVSQAYHLPRALYVARARGMAAQGVVADRHVYRAIVWFHLRELASRTKALLDVIAARPARTH